MAPLDSGIALLLLTSRMAHSPRETLPKPQMVNNSFVIDIVRSIHDIYGFKNFVFYISELLAFDTETSSDFFRGIWKTFPTVPTIQMVNNSENMDGFLSTPTLCLILTTAYDDPIMEISAEALRGVRFLKTIFILFPIMESNVYYNNLGEYNRFYKNIRRTYAWIWRKQFINTILLTIHNNVYILEPYPTRQIVNVTSNWTRETFFVDYSLDFRGYVINSPIRYDLPRVFYMRGPRYGMGKKVPRVSGVSGKLFMVFVEHINARFNETDTDGHEDDPIDLLATIDMIDRGELEISMNSFTGILGSNIGRSYPIGINDWCMMVPYRNESPAYVYLRRSFHSSTWYLLCFSVFYIAMGIWLCSPSRRRDLSMSMLQALCSMMLIPPLRILTIPYARIRFIFVLLFIMGFFTTNLYVTKMASYLTAAPELPQINSVEDVVQAQLPIIVTTYEYDIMMTKNFPPEFMRLMVPVSKAEMDAHRDSFDTAFGYSIQSDRWDFLSIQQRYMSKPLFRLSQICMGPFYHIFPLEKDSHLAKPLQEFMMLAYQYGLMSYWNKEAFADALYLDYVRLLLEHTSVDPLSMTFFRSIWLVWWFGLLLSGVVFCLEVKGYTWQRIKGGCRKVALNIKKSVIHKWWGKKINKNIKK
ncbi:uncharacterized protein LOC142239637 [Haematobia irritans]|uniref:uncharacterized protein LOC142239637 n=1 Tax=Haematobia irritans TaxID=7368 RepID=UPI003F4FA87B